MLDSLGFLIGTCYLPIWHIREGEFCILRNTMGTKPLRKFLETEDKIATYTENLYHLPMCKVSLN